MTVQALDSARTGAVVAVAIIQVGYLSTEYTTMAKPEFTGKGVLTRSLSSSWGMYARKSVAEGMFTASPGRLYGLSAQSDPAASVLYTSNPKWMEDVRGVSDFAYNMHEVWMPDMLRTLPLWENWCLRHVLPPGVIADSCRDLGTMFDMVPQIDPVPSLAPGDVWQDTLAWALRLEQCLLVQEHFKTIQLGEL
jgi:hypothetical protein